MLPALPRETEDPCLSQARVLCFERFYKWNLPVLSLQSGQVPLAVTQLWPIGGNQKHTSGRTGGFVRNIVVSQEF